MAEPSPSSSSQRSSEALKGFTDPEMAAAQQLMQLSGDEEENDCRKSRNKRNPDDGEDELEQNQSDITSAKIEEIFGREEEDEEKQLRPRKRRYRSLVHIYMTTKPVNLKKVRC